MDTALKASPVPMRRRLGVSEYHRMAETGILGPDERVELIDGEIFDMNAIGSPHASVVNRLAQRFSRAVADGLIVVSVQNPLRLDDFSEPVPDFVALAPRPDAYWSSHPTGADALLVVEVSDTSLAHDKAKLPRYARAGVCEVWIVDIGARSILTYRTPDGDRYRDTDTKTGGRVAALRLPEITVAIDTLFG